VFRKVCPVLSAAVYHVQQRTDSPEHMNITRVAYLIFEKAKTKKEINKVVTRWFKYDRD
jgi:hypothetical protein